MTDSGFDQIKSLFSGISTPISLMLSNLIQDPSFSLDPHFYIFLIIGFANFIISLYRFTEKEHSSVKNIWHITGIGLAGFVLVSWAKYYSGLTSIAMEILIIATVIITLFFMRTRLDKRYGKYRVLIYLGLVLSAVIPVMAMLPFEKPVLVVSPLSKFVTLSAPGMNQSVNININSTLGGSHNIQLTAEPYGGGDVLAVYLDGKERGPIEIPYLARGQGKSSVIRIETSPKIPAVTYDIFLNFTYKDLIGNAYTGSNTVEVTVINVSGTPISTTPAEPGFEIVTAILVLVVVIALRKLRFKKAP